MRKLKFQVQISVDGYVAAINGKEDSNVTADEKLWKLINEIADTSDTPQPGRKMSESFSYYLEAVKPDNPKYTFAQKMAKIRKFIFCNTLEKPIGQNASLAKGNLSDEIARLKNKNGKNI